MKLFFCLTIPILFQLNSYAQSEKIEIKFIDSIPSSKQELYTRARSFVAYSFKSSKNVIQMDDKDAGKLICKGSFYPVVSKGTLGITYQNNIDFTLTIDVKENKYRAIISDLYHSGLGKGKEYAGGAFENEKPDCGTFNLPKKDWEKIKVAAKVEAELFLDKLKEAMKKEAKADDF